MRAIIIRDNKLLVMHRIKHGEVYDTLIGGHIEPDETPEQALEREVFEETGLRVLQAQKVFVEEPYSSFGVQQIFLCECDDAEPALRPDADEAKANAAGNNTYAPMWLPLDDLANAPLKSDALKAAMLQSLKNGFPTTPQTL